MICSMTLLCPRIIKSLKNLWQRHAGTDGRAGSSAAIRVLMVGVGNIYPQ